MSDQASIEGQVLVKATARIVSSAIDKDNIVGLTEEKEIIKELIDSVFDKLAEKMDEYKKKDQGNQ